MTYATQGKLWMKSPSGHWAPFGRDITIYWGEPDPEPYHPETLSTEDDYRDAPLGTSVESGVYGEPWIKHVGWWNAAAGADRVTDRTMSRMGLLARRVIRWGPPPPPIGAGEHDYWADPE